MLARSLVREWTTVTVESAPRPLWTIMAAIGLPTMLLRPITTTCFPDVSRPDLTIICCTPAGVAGRKSGLPMRTRPTLVGWKQSTSFDGDIELMTCSSSRWDGSGSCTRKPCIVGSRLSSSTLAMSCSWVVSAGMRMVTDFIPRDSHISPFFLTYTCEAGSSPTSTTARPGVTPLAFRTSILCLSSP